MKDKATIGDDRMSVKERDESISEIVSLRAQVAHWRDAWAAAQVKLDTAPDPTIAVCLDCGVVTRCDEDRCCLTCGRDLVIVADRHSADVLCNRNEEPFPMAPPVPTTGGEE